MFLFFLKHLKVAKTMAFTKTVKEVDSEDEHDEDSEENSKCCDDHSECKTVMAIVKMIHVSTPPTKDDTDKGNRHEPYG